MLLLLLQICQGRTGDLAVVLELKFKIFLNKLPDYGRHYFCLSFPPKQSNSNEAVGMDYTSSMRVGS